MEEGKFFIGSGTETGEASNSLSLAGATKTFSQYNQVLGQGLRYLSLGSGAGPAGVGVSNSSPEETGPNVQSRGLPTAHANSQHIE